MRATYYVLANAVNGPTLPGGVCVHRDSDDGYKTLNEGDRVEFAVVEGKKGIQAEQIELGVQE